MHLTSVHNHIICYNSVQFGMMIQVVHLDCRTLCVVLVIVYNRHCIRERFVVCTKVWIPYISDLLIALLIRFRLGVPHYLA